MSAHEKWKSVYKRHIYYLITFKNSKTENQESGARVSLGLTNKKLSPSKLFFDPKSECELYTVEVTI